ncbi:anion transporter [Campylobacter sp. MIT 99-7217]|uniref:SLC13 family permease n=1 Tax=Campylobacter sp. MIT 99-7217 TaxID=535091 RepID=UPI0011594E2F|nr:SLC13 family permease [Campylobacter sp. MIT 99-7217]TQR29551.1 anion transporter [Campylobacter sp. MIT 99-7217]
MTQAKKTQVNNEEKLSKVLKGIALALFFQIITLLISFFYLHASFKVSVLLSIVAFLVTLWTNKALPIGVVSLLPIILFPSFGILDTHSATANYANPILFLFLGGFMIAAATEKIGLHKVIAKTFLDKFPKTPKGVISALALACVLLGSALSNSTVALLLLPVAMSISEDPFLRTRFLLAIAFAASISGITTPIGSPPNLIYLGFLESSGLESIGFATWIFMMLPLTLLMLVAMVKILSRNTKDMQLDLRAFEDVKINKKHKRMLFFLLALLVVLFLNSPIKPLYNGLGLNENLILLSFGLMMFLPKIGFLTWNDSKSIPYELIFLFGASFCIATAFSQSELGGAFEEFFLLFKDTPFIFFILFACFWAIILTSFLSTTALIAIILPIINVATGGFLTEEQRVLSMLVMTICASFSFIVPISTPPNALVFAQGGISAWDMAKYGFLLALAGVFFVAIFALVYWRWFI